MYKMFVCGGGWAQRLYYGRDKLDCLPPNGFNHYLSLNNTGAHITGERFRATMTLLFKGCEQSKTAVNMLRIYHAIKILQNQPLAGSFVGTKAVFSHDMQFFSYACAMK